ncbi:hypothetical protein [Prevotella sp. tf2-5]|uniref:hypothetical protein n=1 Tax=Prevotella sp. tf2-5 TaxID=1761889 RepID=UPI0008F423DB|nr:hypothetical protein [Prevotella sp. tf2-5]SFO74518.1 hypothetical protein SAMN04487852_106151 [Prevotella sp. tf2-5]
MTNTHNNEDKQKLLKEVKEKVQKLKEYGMSEKEITALFHTEQPLLKLFISKNYKIFLGDERKEVHMEPLVKAVYLLFLKHPEGIAFKNLPDYREELTRIYVRLKPMGMSERVVQSIEDVTNPMLNSINEKCARIRGAFIGQFDDHLARHYYIDGLRGEPKKITLPRDLVIWE